MRVGRLEADAIEKDVEPVAPRRDDGGDGRVGAALTDQSVSLIVKRRAEAAGYAATDFAAHSLRARFLTSAAAAGASIWKMREVSRHKSVQVLSDYVRNSDLLKDHAGKDFL